MLQKNKRPKEVPLQGWFEILFYFGADSVLKSEEYINLKHYMLAEVTLPLGEYYGPYDVYESMFFDSKTDGVLADKFKEETHEEATAKYGLPRMLGEYDIINAVMHDRKTRKVTTMSVILIQEQKNLHLIPQGAQLQYRPGRELAGLRLQTPIPQMSRK
jgi:hypothetical protein